MTNKHVMCDEIPGAAGAYSHVVDDGHTVWTSGLSGQDPTTGEMPQGVAAQTVGCIDNLERALATVGLTLDDVVKVTVHLDDVKEWPTFNEAYAARWPEPYPTRTAVGSSLLDILVEIDVVAARAGS